jgi:dihydropteroate synthase
MKNKVLELKRPAFVMGIVNATPDSFYKSSRGVIDLALRLIDEGADILDIGGESTRPGFTEISEEEEITRIVPLIQKIRQFNDKIPISVDTRKTAVMKAAYENGADVLNDVSALEFDSKMADFISSTELSVILMFWKAGGIKEAKKYLKERVLFAKKSGIKKEKIILDPGIGFDKSFEENCQLIRNCGDLSFWGIPV